MISEIQITALPEEVNDEEALRKTISEKTGEKNFQFQVVKSSIDARRLPIKYNLSVRYALDEDLPSLHHKTDFKALPSDAKSVHIIGAGPAGLFAALQCIQEGIKPIIYERGKQVKDRRRDLAKITKEGIVNPESNYCYGEGGAGTYSDGKLYTRSKKKAEVREVLNLLVQFGADQNILIKAHPHIGTNKLPKIIETIREKILELGGEIHFNAKLTNFKQHANKISEIQINEEDWISVEYLFLATGHSARDVFYLLDEKKVKLEFKPFALGVRVEHPQQFINLRQYKSSPKMDLLPPASYSLVHNTKERGVYSFCMCPGGIIAPCSTEDGTVVTNGWSPSKRNNAFANSGIVTEVRWEDIEAFHSYGALAGLKFQEKVEQDCYNYSNSLKVPAQRLPDFINRKVSEDLPVTSYFPGTVSADLNELLPGFVTKALREGFLNFDKKIKGFISPDAVIHGTESRTSSPVRIPRNRDSFQHVEVKNLYPVAEGAGYAGGIVSAAIDGMLAVRALKNKI